MVSVWFPFGHQPKGASPKSCTPNMFVKERARVFLDLLPPDAPRAIGFQVSLRHGIEVDGIRVAVGRYYHFAWPCLLLKQLEVRLELLRSSRWA